MAKLTKAGWAFVALSSAMIAIKLLFDFYPYDFPVRDQAQAFTWPLVLGVIALGGLGLLTERALALPQPFTDRRSDSVGLWVSIGLGAAYGAITIAANLRETALHPYSTGADWDHVMLPWSIPFYAFGAIFLEFMLRLGALCVLTWLLHVLVLRRHFRLVTYWIVACVVATYEIYPYLADDISAGRWSVVALGVFAPLYWTNVLEAGLMLRYGWLAPIVFRIAFYVVWHMAWGGLARGVSF